MPTPTPDVPTAATPEEVQSFRERQATEWSQYVAVAPITLNGALAYTTGDPVPASNVAKFKYDEQGLVAKVGSAAGRKTIDAVHAAATADQSVDLGAPVSLGVPVGDAKK